MKRLFTALGFSATVALFGYAQESATPRAAANMVCITNADQAAYYAALNQRVLEFKAQSDLLTQLAQDHKKRAQELTADQPAKSHWETELANEFSDKAAAIMPLLSNVSQERLAFEQTHPDLAGLRNVQSATTGGRTADAIVFLGKLEERLAVVQQELARGF